MGVRKIKKDDHWYIDYYVDGRRKREKIGKSKRQAEVVLAKRKVEIAEGKYLDVKKEGRVVFDAFARAFLETHSKINKKPLSYKRDDILVRNLISFFGGKKLSEINPYMIERYKASRIKEVKPATVNREIACLKCIFNKAIEWKKAERNPMKGVKLFKENNQITRYLTKEEIKKLILNCNDILRPIVILALNTGMRKGEILGLKWEQIDISNGIIYLTDTKNSEPREIVMNDTVLRTLSDLKRHPKSPYVFCREAGTPYRDVKCYFSTALKKCDIIDFRFHDLRHTFASYLVMAGIDLRTVMELMGHKSFKMVLRYSHLSPAHKKSAVDKLGDLMDTYMDT